MNNRDYQMCTRCIMDTSDDGIAFDETGVCNHCHEFDNVTKMRWFPDDEGKEKLAGIIEAIKKNGTGKEYDCIIGLSGGIDSSYLALVLKDYNLRPLVVHVDGGWNSELAVFNIEQIVKYCNYDLVTSVIDWEDMRDLQLAYLRAGVANQDVPQDHAFFATMYKFAEQHKVKYILTGANLSTECIRNPLEWMYYQSDSIQLRDIHRKFGTRSLVNFPTTSIIRHKT